MSASRLLDCEEWEAAYNAFEKIMSHRHEVIGLLIKETACELLFTALVTKRTARAEELYTDELDTYIRQYKDVTSSKQRLLCAPGTLPGQGHSKSKGDLRSHLPTEKQILDAGRSQFGHSLDEINPYRQECLVRWNDISFYLLYLLLGCSLCGCSRKQAPKQTQDPDTETTIPYADTIAAPVPPAPAKSRTARYLDSLGFVNIAEADSSIAIDLMYTRADNFTGTLLYEDLKEAYLHPDAMKSLKRAQRLLKEQYPGYSLIVYDAARPFVRTAEDVERSERNLQIHLCLQPLTRRRPAQLRIGGGHQHTRR